MNRRLLPGILILALISCGKKQPVVTGIPVSDSVILSKLSLPDPERDGIVRNRVEKIIVLEKNDSVAYQTYDGLGRQTGSGGYGWAPHRRHYYRSFFWPVSEYFNSGCGGTNYTVQSFLFPSYRRLLLLKWNAASGYCVLATCYQFDSKNHLLSKTELDSEMEDSVVTDYRYKGQLLEKENATIFTKKGGYADLLLQEGEIQEKKSSKIYYYTNSKLDSVTKRYEFLPPERIREDRTYYDEKGLATTMAIKRITDSEAVVVTYKYQFRN